MMKLSLAIVLVAFFSNIAIAEDPKDSAKTNPLSDEKPTVVTTPPTPGAMQQPQVPSPIPEPIQLKKWRLNGSIYLLGNSANQIKFDSVSASGGGQSATGNITFNTATGGGLGAEMWHSEPDAWGWSAGLTINAKREFNSADATLAGSSAHAEYMTPKPTLSFTTLYGNAIYRWSGFYLPFGANISAPNFTQGGGATTAINMTAGLGIQAGVGYHITENFSLEALDRVVSFKMTGSNATYSYDYGTGYYTGIQLNLKFDF